jgi:hypothetical protein
MSIRLYKHRPCARPYAHSILRWNCRFWEDLATQGGVIPKRHALSDELWKRITPSCPGKADGPGRTAADHRLLVEAVLFVLKAGISRKDLSERFGRHNSVWKRFDRCRKWGTGQETVKALEDPELEEIPIELARVKAQPYYSPAGNMTTIPQPKDPSKEYLATYDAWNRLVKLEEEVSSVLETVSTYTYDGRKFQIIQEEYTSGTLSETRHLYYNSAWQNLEDRLGTSPDSADPHQHHIWGLRYIAGWHRLLVFELPVCHRHKRYWLASECLFCDLLKPIDFT